MAKIPQNRHQNDRPKQKTKKATFNNGKNGSTNHVKANHDDVDSEEEEEQPQFSDDSVDDPVRMYLMQMGEIPMLNREEEISSAKRIERTRTLFRNSMLTNDLVLQGAVSALQMVYDGKLRLDRTIEVAVTNVAEKKRIMQRLKPNLKTLRHLLKENHGDFRTAISKSTPISERQDAWRRLIRRRHKAIRLVEELDLRIQRLQPLLEKLEQISKRMTELSELIREAEAGIGNGISLIIFSGIVAEIPRALVTTFELGRTGAISTFMIIGLFILLVLTIMFIVFMERALRKILINYPKRQMGNKIYGGESSHLPLKINQAGVIPAIFASALLLLPITFSNFNFSNNETFLNISSFFSQGQPLYMILYASGIIFFTFFYTSITFNPNETAENLRKYGGFIPGIRPGESTALYIDNILTKLTTIGALYLTLVCLMPEFLIANYPIPFYLGGTSILIVVVVAIDTVTQVQTRLMSSQYEQLIKKTKFGR